MDSLSYYKQVLPDLFSFVRGKEVWLMFSINGDDKSSKRPNFFKTKEELLKFLENYSHVKQFSISASFEIYTNYVFDKVAGWDFLIDLDGRPENLRAAAEVTHAIHSHITENFKITPQLFFSGNKGFGIFFPCETIAETKTKFPDKARQIAESLAEKFSKELKKAGVTLDTQIYSHRKGGRIPFSVHHKSGLVRTPLIPYELENFDKTKYSPERVLENIEEYRERIHRVTAKGAEMKTFFDDPALTKRDMEVRELLQKQELKAKHEAPTFKGKLAPSSEIGTKFFPPCFAALIQNPKPNHIGRLALVIFLIRAGFSDAQIQKSFGKFANYDSTITQQQIDHAREKNYNCYACVSMEKNGLCLPNVACGYMPQRYPLYYYQRAKEAGL